MSDKIPQAGELAELLPNAAELEDLCIEIVEGDEARSRPFG